MCDSTDYYCLLWLAQSLGRGQVEMLPFREENWRRRVTGQACSKAPSTKYQDVTLPVFPGMPIFF